RGRRNAVSFGIPFEADLSAAVGRTDVDCFIVASETNKHADLCIAAMEAGKAVLLQKPMAITLTDCDRIIETVERTGVWFSMAFVEGPSKWHISAEANKGMFFDDATHALDWLYWTTGRKPVSVIAEIDNVLTDVAPDDTGVALFRFEDGLFADIMNTSVA